MVLSIKFRPRAEQDLEDIWNYTVARWSADQAISYLEGLKAAIDLLAEFPEMARLRSEFRPAVRLHPVREHLVIYIAHDDALEIIRVVHTRSNWSVLLTE